MPCVPRSVLVASETEKENPEELRDETPFRAFGKGERSLHRVPGPCSQVRLFLLAELKRDTPRNFNMKRFNIRPFFAQISGRNFLPEIFGEVHPETAPSPSSVRCPLLYRTEHFSRGRKR